MAWVLGKKSHEVDAPWDINPLFADCDQLNLEALMVLALIPIFSAIWLAI